MDSGGKTEGSPGLQAMLDSLDEYIAAIETASRRLKPYFIACASIALLASAGLLHTALRIHEKGSHSFLAWLPLLFMILLTAAALGALGVRISSYAGLHHQLQIDRSALGHRLALGELDNDACVAHTPACLRWMMKQSTRDKAEILIRIAAHPAWFLAPPRIHVRPAITMLLGFMPMVAVIVFNALLMSSFGANFRPYLAGIPVLLAWFVVFDAALKRENLRQLEAHLKESRKELSKELTSEGLPSTTEAGSLPVHSNAAVRRATGLQMILNQLEQDMQAGKSLIAIIPGQTAGLLCFAPMMTSGEPLAYLLVLITASAVAFFALRSWIQSYRSELRDKLSNSGLAILLASGDVRDDEIFEHTPAMLRWFLHFPRKPKSYADQLQSLLWRAAFNLEFYLERPAVYYRTSWLLSGAALLLIALNMGRFMSIFVSGTYISMDAFRNFFFYGGLLLTIWLGREAWKQIVNADELLRYLREHLDS